MVVLAISTSPVAALEKENVSLEALESFATVLRGLATALFVIALVWGGIKILVSGGDAKAMQEGKNIVKNAVIGYIIAMLASLIPTIVNYVGPIKPIVLINAKDFLP